MPREQEDVQKAQTNMREADSSAWMPRQIRGTDESCAPEDAKRAQASSKKEKRAPKREVREYTLGEEIANSVSHGIGALLALVACYLCTKTALQDGGGIVLVAALVYSISMFLEYLMSTLYHAITADGAKRVFKVLDHSCIYLFIAGTYTPFCLINMANYGGTRLAIFVWAVAIIGICCEAFWVFRPRWVSAAIYLLLGWAVVSYVPILLKILDPVCFNLLLVGGILYSIGCIFYVMKKVPYMHTVFHLFVLAASVVQFFAVLFYAL